MSSAKVTDSCYINYVSQKIVFQHSLSICHHFSCKSFPFLEPKIDKKIHIGEVFEVVKNNHMAKKGSRGRGEEQVVSATGQESCISKFCHELQGMSRLRELK